MLAARVKRLSKDSLVYGVGGALVRSLGLILVPVYIQLFSPPQYGIYTNILNFSALFYTFVASALEMASTICYFDTEDKVARREILSAWLYINLIVSVPILLLLMLAAPLAGLAVGNSSYGDLMVIAILSVPFTLLTSTFSTVLRLNFRPIANLILSAAATVLSVGLGLALVGVFHMGIAGALIGPLAGGGLATLLGFWLTHDNYISHLNRAAAGKIFHLGWPLLPGSFANWVNTYATTLFVGWLMTQGDAGLFSIAMRITSLVGIAMAAFQMAWGPYSLSIANEHNPQHTYAKVLTYYMVSFCGLALAVGLFGREILIVLDRQHLGYVSAYRILGLLIFATVINGAHFITWIGSSIAKKTVNASWTNVTAACFNIVANLALIPLLGTIGAALAALGTGILITWLAYNLAQRDYPIPYEMSKVALAALVGLVLMAAGLFVTPDSWWLDVFIKLVLLLLYVAAILAFGIINRREVQVAQRAVLIRIGRPR